MRNAIHLSDFFRIALKMDVFAKILDKYNNTGIFCT